MRKVQVLHCVVNYPLEEITQSDDKFPAVAIFQSRLHVFLKDKLHFSHSYSNKSTKQIKECTLWYAES